ncbi:MAG: hypothetical protein MUC47_07615, partial [Candidatus Kapabacteria bacterium]|nr:hypothetical protein [Candidatus Kapabacteria bacterium]
MARPILRSRWFPPPIRTDDVPRGPLVERLASSSQRIVLVAAPAGFGKSTLVSQWFHTVPFAKIWMSCSEFTSGPESFIAHIVGAIRESIIYA